MVKTRSMSMSKPFFEDVPREIIADILIRLPVKTLIGFRCVCKLWQFLISNPNFIKTHLLKSANINNYSNQMLLLNHVRKFENSLTDPWFLVSCSLKSLFYSLPKSVSAVELDYPLKNVAGLVLFVGSCNGLVCFVHIKVGVFLWNPSTRKLKQLPLSGTAFQLVAPTAYGFGYDQRNDDYKVVWAVSRGGVVGVRKIAGKIYSLKTNSWRQIENFPHGFPGYDYGNYGNGKLHWKVRTASGSDPSMVIVSLDLGSETYGEIAQPRYDEGNVSYLSLGVLEGCLSVFCHYDNDDVERSHVDIWVMKEYDVSDTWMKLYAVPYGADSANAYFSPLCVSVTGEILLKYNWRLFLYNPNNERFRNLKIGNLRKSLQGLEAITYVDSLVSPDIYVEVPSP